MKRSSLDSFGCCRTLEVEGSTHRYFSLSALSERVGCSFESWPFALKVLLENLLRNEDGQSVTEGDIRALFNIDLSAPPSLEIAFCPARVVLQDFTGVPAVVDLAAMRDAVSKLGGDPAHINPLFPAELVIDHSVQVDHYGSADALVKNRRLEYDRNRERYVLLRWAQTAFSNFRVIAPSTGIVHQVNLEHLARVVCEQDGMLYPDTLVGTDSHTTMINGMGVLGWGVGGIEAEAAMLGQPINLLVPPVIGVGLTGRLPPGTTATDLVLTLTQRLRQLGVVGKFLEFFGDGLSHLSLADRATLSNMCPEYGATAALFPIDEETLRYLRLTGRPEAVVARVEAYAKAQGMFRTPEGPYPTYQATLTLDLGSIESTLAGPRRPQDRVALQKSASSWRTALPGLLEQTKHQLCSAPPDIDARIPVVYQGQHFDLCHGSVVIAAITSCTNTSNPAVMIAAGLLAQNAARRGLRSQPWVKTSLSPGSRVVTRYLERASLLEPLQRLGFYDVGYGCTTCIGNSGPLPEPIGQAVREHGLVVASVLSGNRNFEGRISPDVRANYLASPPLVVAFALAGRIDIDFEKEALGADPEGQPVYLRDLWPSSADIEAAVAGAVSVDLFRTEYNEERIGDETWRGLPVPQGNQFAWDPDSSYVRSPSFFEDITLEPRPLSDIRGARILLLLGDSVTTDHISPAGSIGKDSPAARYLIEKGVKPADFNSYGARRGNHEVMVRGTFANPRLRNRMVPGSEGGVARHLPSGEVDSVFAVAQRYRGEHVPLVVVAGREYGSGSSRDWAAKGPALLGIRAVMAQSFERIHRSNLIGMGILPLQFLDGQGPESLRLDGEQTLDLDRIAAGLEPGQILRVRATNPDGAVWEFDTTVRIDTRVELEYYRHGGILNLVLRQVAGLGVAAGAS